jgi:hypothetical protein
MVVRSALAMGEGTTRETVGRAEGVPASVLDVGAEGGERYENLAHKVVATQLVVIPHLHAHLTVVRAHLEEEFAVEDGVEVLLDHACLLLGLAHEQLHVRIATAAKVLRCQITRLYHLHQQCAHRCHTRRLIQQIQVDVPRHVA